jgi:hypothetical protein
MNTFVKISCLLVALLATGCATLPTPEKMKEDTANFQVPVLPSDGKAMVYVVRPSALGTRIRFNVFVDNKEAASEVGYTRGGQYIYFPIAPGDHQILSKAENWAEANITAKAGDIIFLQQEPQMGVLMARNSIVKVEAYEGKYQVKHLKLGTIGKSDGADEKAEKPKKKKK